MHGSSNRNDRIMVLMYDLRYRPTYVYGIEVATCSAEHGTALHVAMCYGHGLNADLRTGGRVNCGPVLGLGLVLRLECE